MGESGPSCGWRGLGSEEAVDPCFSTWASEDSNLNTNDLALSHAPALNGMNGMQFGSPGRIRTYKDFAPTPPEPACLSWQFAACRRAADLLSSVISSFHLNHFAHPAWSRQLQQAWGAA